MNSEQQKQAIEWAIERLELCQDQAFQSCECEECQQCGKMPDECTGTDCAKTCQCSSCDHCGNEAAITELRALLDAPVECRCKRYGKDNPHWPCPVHAAPGAQPHGDLLARFPEINFSNYGEQEVEALQAWAFEALDQIQAASLTNNQQRQAVELLNLAEHALSHASLNAVGDVIEHTQDRRDHMRVQIIAFLKALGTLQLAAQVNQSDESATCAKSQVELQAVPVSPCDWTDRQILDFLGVALRNVDLVGAVYLSEIRQGFEYMRDKAISDRAEPTVDAVAINTSWMTDAELDAICQPGSGNKAKRRIEAINKARGEA